MLCSINWSAFVRTHMGIYIIICELKKLKNTHGEKNSLGLGRITLEQLI
jgi:hypothetical protein